MKKLILVYTLFTSISICYSQNKNEIEVRKIDSLEANAFLKNDIVALEKIWDPEFVVTNPFNMVFKIPQIKDFMQNKKITQINFVRKIEKITFNENIAIVMGSETPEKNSAAVGVPESLFKIRRFTNVWMKKKKEWKLVARQATNI